MTDHDTSSETPSDITPADAKAPRSLRRRALEGARYLGGEAVRAGLETLAKQAEERLLPNLERLVDWATAPEHIEQVQQVMARTAQLGIEMGFRADGRAALLFDFADWMEQEHGREAVARQIWQHNSLLDGTMLALLEARIGSLGQHEEAVSYHQQLENVRLNFMELICSLAQLEEGTPLPQTRRIDELREYFERAILPERFMILAGLGAGDPEAFAELERRRAAEQARGAARAEGLGRRLFRRLFAAQEGASAEDAASDALARRQRRQRGELVRSSQRDPSYGFLVNSYLFFLQTYTTRHLIERFPEMIAVAREFEQPPQASSQDEDAAADILVVSDEDATSSASSDS